MQQAKRLGGTILIRPADVEDLLVVEVFGERQDAGEAEDDKEAAS